jgi:hypothetical protein
MSDHLMINEEEVHIQIIVGDGKEVMCTKHGDILLHNHGTNEMLLLKRVLYTPSFHKNIVSIGMLLHNSCYGIKMQGNAMILMKKGSTNVLCFKQTNNEVLYYFEGTRELMNELILNVELTREVATPNRMTQIDINDAHEKLGHIWRKCPMSNAKTH